MLLSMKLVKEATMIFKHTLEVFTFLSLFMSWQWYQLRAGSARSDMRNQRTR